MENGFLKTIFQTFLHLFVITKVDQMKIWFSFRKVFFYFGRKTLSRSCEKFRNIMLFTDYIKFSLQSFDCYIFCFEIFFSISSLIIWFNLIFISTLVFIFMIFICFSLIIFLIEILYLLDLILIFLKLFIFFKL
jgi:hypothetical protein